MTRTAVPPAHGDVVHQLINKYLVPAPGRSPDKIKSRLLHWIAVANDPATFAPANASAKDMAKLRHNALQNIRRLAAKYPAVAVNIIATVKPEVTR